MLTEQALCVDYDTLGSLSPPALACVNRLVRAETLPIFYGENRFSLRFANTRKIRHRTKKWKVVIDASTLDGTGMIRNRTAERIRRRAESGKSPIDWSVCMPVDEWITYMDMFQCFAHTSGLRYIKALEICYYEPTWGRKIGCRFYSSSAFERLPESAVDSSNTLLDFGHDDMSLLDPRTFIKRAVDRTRRAVCRYCSRLAFREHSSEFKSRLIYTICD